MTLSIIIPTHKRAFQAQMLLNSIAKQNFAYKDLQLLLISNLKDKTLRKVTAHWNRVFFDFKYLEVGAKGVNKARNLGIRFARGDILYFLDDDCILDDKDHLNKLLLEHEKSAIGIGGGYKAFNNSHGLKKFYQENANQWMQSSALPKDKSSQLVGGNASYKKKVFDKGFYFDSSIIFGGSEESFNQALIKQGWTLLFIDKLSCLHNVQLNWLLFIKKSFKQGIGSVKNHSKTEDLYSLKKDWAFLHGNNTSIYFFAYNLFFKLGFFWALSSVEQKSLLFRSLKFIFLFLKSRLYFFKEHIVKWLYGNIILKTLGKLWFAIGWLYGQLFLKTFVKLILRPLGTLWFATGWLYGNIILKTLGKLWFAIGWLYGQLFLKTFVKLILRPLGTLWFATGWLYGNIILKTLGKLWFAIGWLYGQLFLKTFVKLILRPLGTLWFATGWLYGNIILKTLGKLWFAIGWLYGQLFLKTFVKLILRPLGTLWFATGWLYGNIILVIIHHSPPMKIYYFSKYQYYKRIKKVNPLKNS